MGILISLESQPHLMILENNVILISNRHRFFRAQITTSFFVFWKDKIECVSCHPWLPEVCA